MKEKIKNIWQHYNVPIIVSIISIVLIIVLLKQLPSKTTNVKISKKSDMIANTSAELIKEEKYEGMTFSNISLISKKGYSTFTADVINTTSETINIKNVNIVLKDKSGNIVTTLLGNIGNPLKPNETRTITASTKGSLKGVVSKTITKSDY